MSLKLVEPDVTTERADLCVLPFDVEVHGKALLEAAAADDHKPLNVTHVIARGGEIVGYLCINSLPLYRLWMDSKKTRAADSAKLLFLIENQYRMAGAGVVATIVNGASPFFGLAQRSGYHESEGDRLFLKGL